MTTKNIKTDYGALGDGQIATVSLTIANGSKSLSSSTNLWLVGDVGKHIAFKNALGVGFLSTIATFTDQQHIVLADAFTGTSLSGASTIVEWGTPDDVAISNFNADFVGLSGTRLEAPAGRYPCLGTSIMGPFLGPGFGIPDFTLASIDGNGAAVLTDFQGTGSFWLGGTRLAQAQNATGSARVQTVLKNALVITLVDAAKASRFTVNRWALLTGVDLQAFGGPTNQGYWEPVLITNITGGVITVQSPVQATYKSTWPLWSPGDASNLDFGGPATLYDLNTIVGYDCVHEYINMGLEQQGQINALGRKITFTGGYIKGAGIYASLCPEWTATNVDSSATNKTEWDKSNGIVTIRGGRLHGNNFQSPSGNYTFDGVDCGDFNGTPKQLRLLNCIVTSVTFGPNSYGRDESVYAENSSFTGLAALGVLGGVTEADITGAGAYTMANGIISRVKSAGSGAPPQWANQDGYVIYGSRFPSEGVFRILDIFEDGASIYIRTDRAGGFPSPVSPQTMLSFSTHPCPDFTFVNCTGHECAYGWSGAAARRPIGSGWKRTYTGDIGAILPVIPMFGRLVTAKFTVNVPYSGGTFALNGGGSPFVVQTSSNSAMTWNPSIDLTVPGTRTVTASGVTGSAGAEQVSLTLPGDGNIWLVPNQITPKMTSVTGGGSITLEFTTDQGLLSPAVVPLRLRLHA